ncbi:uncharacterized protein LOC134695029 isoform X2 [Mytilus trossulus]|uniref:uncharacterized protein LOC134695029 isoform X2 n=1 Tax=Mytilus trossulus TaxID=6551 RepID=UPI003006D8B5
MAVHTSTCKPNIGAAGCTLICLALFTVATKCADISELRHLNVNLTLMTDLVFTKTVSFRCSSNNGNGTWFVFKGSSRDVLFQDKAIGNGYKESKFTMDYFSKDSIQISIRKFDKNDIDVYMCSHKDKSSNQLNMGEIEYHQTSVNLTLMTDLVFNNTVKLKCTSNNGYGTWFMYKGTNHSVLFQDEVIGSQYKTSKYSMVYFSQDSLEMSIMQFDTDDLDVYMCKHEGKSSNLLDLRVIRNITEITSEQHEAHTHVAVIVVCTVVIIIGIVVAVIFIKRRNRGLEREKLKKRFSCGYN